MVFGVVNLFGVETLAASAAATLVPLGHGRLAGRGRPRNPRRARQHQRRGAAAGRGRRGRPGLDPGAAADRGRGRRGRAWASRRGTSRRRSCAAAGRAALALRSFVAALGLLRRDGGGDRAAGALRAEMAERRAAVGRQAGGHPARERGPGRRGSARRHRRQPRRGAGRRRRWSRGRCRRSSLREATGIAVAPEEFLDLLAPAVACLGGAAGAPRASRRSAPPGWRGPRGSARRSPRGCRAGRSPGASRPWTRPARWCSPPPTGRVALPAAEVHFAGRRAHAARH